MFGKIFGAIANPIAGLGQALGGSTGLNPVDATLASLPIIGDAFGAQQNRQFQSEQASAKMGFEDSQALRQMNFQERMSNTAHQRQAADLKAAGLNPMLAANSGAAVGSGASATGAMGSGDSRQTANSANKLLESAYKREQGKADSQIQLNKQMTETQKELQQVHANSAKKIKKEQNLVDAQTHRTVEDANTLREVRDSEKWRNYSNAAKNAKDMFIPSFNLNGQKKLPKGFKRINPRTGETLD